MFAVLKQWAILRTAYATCSPPLHASDNPDLWQNSTFAVGKILWRHFRVRHMALQSHRYYASKNGGFLSCLFIVLFVSNSVCPLNRPWRFAWRWKPSVIRRNKKVFEKNNSLYFIYKMHTRFFEKRYWNNFEKNK